MSRVTKIAHERLVELAASSPTFAPGAENYRRMGGIEAIWPAPSAELLEQALAIGVQPDDQRMGRATERGGRLLARRIAETVENAAVAV